MSGGVDSAVALLEAGAGAVGVTLRLWIDPRASRQRARLLLARGGGRRARDLPPARATARHARPARGLPQRGRGAVHARLRPRGDARTPAAAATASFRFDELLRFAATDRRGPARDRALRPHRRARRRASRSRAAADAAKDQSYMLATLDPALLGAALVPAGGADEGGDARARRAPPALAAAAAPESQEACFLGGDDYRDFLAREGLPLRSGPLARREWPRARPSRRLLALHARPAPRPTASPRPSRSTRSRPTPTTNTVRVGPRASLAPPAGARAGAPRHRRRTGRGQAPLPLAGRRGARRARPRPASSSRSTCPPTGSRAARRPSSTTTTPSSGRA